MRPLLDTNVRYVDVDPAPRLASFDEVTDVSPPVPTTGGKAATKEAGAATATASTRAVVTAKPADVVPATTDRVVSHETTTTVTATPAGKSRLAIVPLTVGEGVLPGDTGSVMAEGIECRLKNPSYDLIERMQLLDVIKAKNFQVNDLFTRKQSVGELGKLVDANYLLIGMVCKLKVTYQVTAKIVDLDSNIHERGVVFFENMDESSRYISDLARQLGSTTEKQPSIDYLKDAMTANDGEMFDEMVTSAEVDLNALLDGQVPLYAAIVKERSDMAVSLVKHGAKLDLRTPDGKSLLYAAAEHGLPDVIKAMVDKGVAVDSVNDETGRTALYAAIYYRKPEAVTALLDRKADLDHKDKRPPETPRSVAVEVDSADVTAAIKDHEEKAKK